MQRHTALNEQCSIIFLKDHNYQLPSAIELKSRLDCVHNKREHLEKNVKNSRRREKRAKHSVAVLLQDLKDQRLVNEEIASSLKCYSGNDIFI